jgi:UDP-N-acetylglucosamine acyltransferase
MAYCHIAHDCIIGNNVIISNAVNMAGHVEIDEYVGIGGLTAIHQFVKIGQHCFVGGGLRVQKDIPPYILAMGEPMQYGGVNHVGLSRRGFSLEVLREIKRAYKIYYFRNLTKKEAMEQIRKELNPFPEIEVILQFLERSERGVIRGSSSQHS